MSISNIYDSDIPIWKAGSRKGMRKSDIEEDNKSQLDKKYKKKSYPKKKKKKKHNPNKLPRSKSKLKEWVKKEEERLIKRKRKTL